jgi:hypothetical protein
MVRIKLLSDSRSPVWMALVHCLRTLARVSRSATSECAIFSRGNLEEIRLTLMPGARPLFKQSANLIGIQLHHVLPKVHRVVATIPGSLRGIVDMPTSKKHAAVGPSPQSKVVELNSDERWVNKKIFTAKLLTSLLMASDVHSISRAAAALLARALVVLCSRCSASLSRNSCSCSSVSSLSCSARSLSSASLSF